MINTQLYFPSCEIKVVALTNEFTLYHAQENFRYALPYLLSDTLGIVLIGRFGDAAFDQAMNKIYQISYGKPFS